MSEHNCLFHFQPTTHFIYSMAFLEERRALPYIFDGQPMMHRMEETLKFKGALMLKTLIFIY